MAGGPSCEEQQRIFLANGIRFLHFPKQAVGISELRLELGPDFFSNFIAAAVNSGTNHSLKITRATAEAADHLADAFLHDALKGAAPTRVKDPDGVLPGVDQDHWQAVGRLNRQQQAGRRGDHPIPDEWFVRNAFDKADDVGMNLAQSDHRPERSPVVRAIHRSEFLKKSRTIARHRGLGVVFGETEVEIALAVSPRRSSEARGETVDQPGNSLEMLGPKNLD